VEMLKQPWSPWFGNCLPRLRASNYIWFICGTSRALYYLSFIFPFLIE
jgi:hypothetical protein